MSLPGARIPEPETDDNWAPVIATPTPVALAFAGCDAGAQMPGFLAPPIQHRLIAHRGGGGLRPENTLEAFEHAVREFNADVLELDVHASSDGVIFIAHDDTLERCTNGHGDLAALTSSQLEQLDAGHQFSADGQTYPYRGKGIKLPRLAALLGAFPDLRLNIEVKARTPGLIDAFVKQLRQAKAVDRCCVGSEHDDIGVALVEALPEGCHFFPSQALTQLFMSLWSGEAAQVDRRYHVIDMPAVHEGLSLAEPAFLEIAHGLGRPVYVFTVDEEAEMRSLFAAGVDGVMTDRPDRLRRVINGLGR